MHYNFVEIGTSNFRTLIQTVGDDQTGISVEPIKHYLDQLPNRDNVIKLQTAITLQPESDTIDIYWIPQHVIEKHRLAHWLKGCNSVNEPHIHHKSMKITHLVEKMTVPVMSVKRLVEQYNITKLDLVKIDCEGHDTVIMEGFYNEIVEKGISVAKFVFESNATAVKSEVARIIKLYTSIGYTIANRGHDTVLVKN